MGNKAEITVFNTKVRVIRVEDDDYFCITDLAKYKNPDTPNSTILSWINAKPNMELVYYWELKHNPGFKRTPQGMFKGFPLYLAEGYIKNQSFPANWVSYTNAIGLKDFLNPSNSTDLEVSPRFD